MKKNMRIKKGIVYKLINRSGDVIMAFPETDTDNLKDRNNFIMDYLVTNPDERIEEIQEYYIRDRYHKFYSTLGFYEIGTNGKPSIILFHEMVDGLPQPKREHGYKELVRMK